MRPTLSTPTLVTIRVLYWRPDFTHLLNEFTWQTDDVAPRFPRVCSFLEHWRRDVQAVIREVSLAHSANRDWRNIDLEALLR